MAHTCPECGQYCHCSGDIDDINFGPLYGCCHCDPDESDDDDWLNDAEWEEKLRNPVNSLPKTD